MKRTTFKIAIRTDERKLRWHKKQVTGYCLNEFFGAHREDGKRWWTVTHLPSGRAATLGLLTLRECKEIADALVAEPVDWSTRAICRLSKSLPILQKRRLRQICGLEK